MVLTADGKKYAQACVHGEAEDDQQDGWDGSTGL